MRRLPLLIAAVLAAACPAFAWGDEFRIVPSFAVKEAYNSNILLSEDDAMSDFVTTVSPGMEIVNRTERLDAGVLLRLNGIDYARYDEFSAIDQVYSGRLSYRITPLIAISAEAAYVRDTNPDSQIETTGIVLSADPRHRISSSLSAEYQATEKTAGVMIYHFVRNDFESESDLNDVSHDVTVGLVHDFGSHVPTLKGRMNAGYSYYDTADAKIQGITGTIGASWDINELWSIAVDSGGRFTWSDVVTTQTVPVYGSFFGIPVLIGTLTEREQVNDTSWGWVGGVSLNYKGEHGSGSLSYRRDIQPASGLGGETERNSVALSAQYQLTYELGLLLTASYFTNKSGASELSAQEIDQRTLIIRPGCRYDFSRDVAAEASYEYTRFSDEVENTEADRHLVSVRVILQHSFFK